MFWAYLSLLKMMISMTFTMDLIQFRFVDLPQLRLYAHRIERYENIIK